MKRRRSPNRHFLDSQRKRGRRKPPRRDGGGSETVPVEPDRPKLGEGGAEAALEYDS